jgi:hypothetical protein
MRTKLLITFAAVLLALPAIALAQRYRTNITAHVTDGQDSIFGEVRSKIFACEKRREVRLYGPPFENGVEGKRVTKGGQEFRRYGIKLTNRFGDYRFDSIFDADYGGSPLKRGNGGFFLDGDYFTRARRKDFPGDACRRDDSPIVSISVND